MIGLQLFNRYESTEWTSVYNSTVVCFVEANESIENWKRCELSATVLFSLNISNGCQRQAPLDVIIKCRLVIRCTFTILEQTNKQTKLINRISVNNYERQTLYKAGECMI